MTIKQIILICMSLTAIVDLYAPARGRGAPSRRARSTQWEERELGRLLKKPVTGMNAAQYIIWKTAAVRLSNIATLDKRRVELIIARKGDDAIKNLRELKDKSAKLAQETISKTNEQRIARENADIFFDTIGAIVIVSSDPKMAVLKKRSAEGYAKDVAIELNSIKENFENINGEDKSDMLSEAIVQKARDIGIPALTVYYDALEGDIQFTLHIIINQVQSNTQPSTADLNKSISAVSQPIVSTELAAEKLVSNVSDDDINKISGDPNAANLLEELAVSSGITPELAAIEETIKKTDESIRESKELLEKSKARTLENEAKSKILEQEIKESEEKLKREKELADSEAKAQSAKIEANARDEAARRADERAKEAQREADEAAERLRQEEAEKVPVILRKPPAAVNIEEELE